MQICIYTVVFAIAITIQHWHCVSYVSQYNSQQRFRFEIVIPSHLHTAHVGRDARSVVIMIFL